MQLCSSLSILWHCLSLWLEWKLTFCSPVATAEFSKCAGSKVVPLYIYAHTHTHTHTYIYILLWFIVGCWIQFYVLYSRTLLFIHSIYNGLYLLTLTSHSIPLQFPSPHTGNHNSVILFLFHRYVHFCHILIPNVSDILQYLSFSFCLTSLSMKISRFIHVAAKGIIYF